MVITISAWAEVVGRNGLAEMTCILKQQLQLAYHRDY